MFLNKLHWGALAWLAFTPLVVLGAEPEGKGGKRLLCQPECGWQDAPRKKLDLSVDHLTRDWQSSDAGAGQGGTLDLWHAVSLAVQTYPSIRDAAAQLDQQREAINVARAGYLPTIQTGLNTGKQGAYGSGQNLSLSASQMIYDFGKVANAVKGAEAGVQVRPTLESNSMIVLFSHIRTGKWSSIMPLNLTETFGFSEPIRSIPIVDPDARHTVGLVAAPRQPQTPLVSALLDEAMTLASDFRQER